MSRRDATKAAPVDEYDRIAVGLEETAKLLRTYGATAVERLDAWMTGPRSPALQPVSGARYETCDDPLCAPECTNAECRECPDPSSPDPARRWHRHDIHSHLLPGDPVGETVAAGVDAIGMLSGELRAQLDDVETHAHRIRVLVKIACRDARDDRRTISAGTREEIAAAGFCASCYRVDKTLVEIATVPDKKAPDGRRVLYAEYCRWCGDRVGEWRHLLGAQAMLPLELVRLHLAGKRVTEKTIIDVITRVWRQRTGAPQGTPLPLSPMAGATSPTVDERSQRDAERAADRARRVWGRAPDA